MKGRHAALASTILAVGGLASPVRAWQPLDESAPRWSGPVPYTLNEVGSEDLGGFEGTEPIVREGFDDWARVACTGLETDYRGSTTDRPFQTGQYVVGWIESGWPHSPGAIGVTGPRWNGAAEIIDAHMAMNGENFTWSTEPGAGSRVHAYSITLHEAGHFFGLGHSADADATMYYSYSGGVEEINADDREGICALYPEADDAPVDCTEAGCPDGQECIDGACRTPEEPGDGDVCDPCGGDAACGGADDLCLRYPDGGQFCGATCGDDSECDVGSCEEVSSGVRQCVVRDSAGDPSCTAANDGGDDGETEGDGEDTGRGDETEPGDDTGSPGDLADVGETCTTNDDCTTDVCARDESVGHNFCTDLCESDEECPDEFACVDTGGGIHACQPDVGDLGDECDTPDHCASGMCAAKADGDQFCTRDCTSGEICPDGYECIDATGGDQRVCVHGSSAAGGDADVIVGGCSAGGPAPHPAGGLGIALAAVLLLRRRRS